MARLDGRVAILTGGAKGIGKHYARALAAEGARLMIADIADGSEVAAVLARDYGANSVESAVTDVSDEGAVAALVARTRSASARSTFWSTMRRCWRRCRKQSAPKSMSLHGTVSWRSICAGRFSW